MDQIAIMLPPQRGSKTSRKLTPDISVGKRPDLPDLPATTWTLTLAAVDQDVHRHVMEATVAPKAGQENVKSHQGNVLVKATFESSGFEKVGAGFGQWRIGPHGIETGPDNDLEPYVQRFRFRGGKQRKGGDESYVQLRLSFFMEKTLEQRDDDQPTFDSGLLNDCTLVCDGEKFRVHHAILAAQSPVFAAMFQTLPDQSSGICIIDDIGMGVLGALLMYVYIRNLSQMEDNLDKMWLAADKYAMMELKVECERIMMATIKKDNAVKILIFAAQHGLSKLMMKAAKIVRRMSV